VLLSVEMRLPGAVAFRPLAARVRFTSAGYFCLSGVAEQVFPQGLAPDAELELRFLVRAPSYADLTTVVSIPASVITVQPVEEVLAGHTLPLRLISAPVL